MFFFSSRRRHTRFDCDWSSDVCSSDLTARRRRAETPARASEWTCEPPPMPLGRPEVAAGPCRGTRKKTDSKCEIGRASCRERSVDLGGRRIIKKKKEYIGETKTHIVEI